jgi:23S rRNA pseudouridine2605 synthase
VVRELGVKVLPERDDVALDGRKVLIQQYRYLAFHKPPRLLCTRQSTDEKKTIFHYLSSRNVDTDALLYVGRLDFLSEGLLLLTTDGQWAQEVSHPRFHLPRVYHVEIIGPWTAAMAQSCLDGIFDSQLQVLLTVSSVRKLEDRSQGRSRLIEIELLEGRNRQIRRMMKHLGVSIQRIRRVSIGPVQLGMLPLGATRNLTPWEIETLRATAAKGGS